MLELSNHATPNLVNVGITRCAQLGMNLIVLQKVGKQARNKSTSLDFSIVIFNQSLTFD